MTITHRNILANIIPIEREIAKYRKYARPFHPIRFLNLLPLSHMFGQSMATFVPPMLAGTVVFSHGYSPVEILRQIKTRRVSVLVCVPKVLDVLREHVQRVCPDTAEADALAGKHSLWRWWRYREVHRLFGWKFWCIVCGAAPLEPELEAFWRKLGFLVVQGYGLTETAPIVTLNHPFRASQGTVGTPIGGVEVEDRRRRRDSRPRRERHVGLLPADRRRRRQPRSAAAFKDGWFHTGDIGELDAAGRLLIKGRKKEMIVTPQGLNVFPGRRRARARGAARRRATPRVVGVPVDGEERVHAVLVARRPAPTSRRDRPRRQRDARRSPARLEHVDLAGRRRCRAPKARRNSSAAKSSAGSRAARAARRHDVVAARPSRTSSRGTRRAAMLTPRHDARRAWARARSIASR